MSKPTKRLNWMPGGTSPEVIEPTSGEQIAGYVPNQRPPAQIFNWILQNMSEWLAFIDELSIQREKTDIPTIIGGDKKRWLLEETPISDDAVHVKLDGVETWAWTRSGKEIDLDDDKPDGSDLHVSYSYGISVGNPIFEPVYHTVTVTDIANKYFVLPSTPGQPTKVIFDIPTGAPQTYGIDFVVIGDHLDWNGLGLEGQILDGMNVRAILTS